MTLINDLGLVCSIVNNGANNSITGRTRLQKTAYFCQYLDWKDRYTFDDYKLDYYGPISLFLRSVLRDAISTKCIAEENNNPGDLPTFTLTDKGKDLLKGIKQLGEIETEIQKTEQITKYLAKWSKEDLIIVSTIDIIDRYYPDITRKQLIDKICSIREHFSTKQVKDAYKKWIGLKKFLKQL